MSEDLKILSGGTASDLPNLIVSSGTSSDLPAHIYGSMSSGEINKDLLRREYRCYVNIDLHPLEYPVVYYSTDADYWEGQWYEDKIINWPSPQDSTGDAYNILTKDSFTLELEDADLSLALGYLQNWIGLECVVYLVTRRFYADGTQDEVLFSRWMTITAWQRSGVVISLTLSDIDDKRLEKLYPQYTYKVDETYFPDLLEDDVGAPIPYVVGTGIKIQAVLVNNNDGNGPFVYSLCIAPDGASMSVLAVYRGEGVLVDASEYTADTLACGDYSVVILSFPYEQLDFNFQHYLIQADVQNTATNANAATELNRILTWAGLTMDANALADAEAIADECYMNVSAAYGRERNQVAVRSIVEQLLVVLRGQLFRDTDGEYILRQDVPSSVQARYYADSDLCEVSNYGKNSPPATVTVKYRPNIVTPTELQHTLTRTISGGLTGEASYELPLVRDFATADRFSSYITKRLSYNETATATVYNVQHKINDLIDIYNCHLWTDDKTWRIVGIQRNEDCNILDLQQYHIDVYLYDDAGVEPDDGSGYETDYSKTPPEAPTDLVEVDSGLTTLSTGEERAWTQWRCTPPAANWAKIYLATVSIDTGQIQMLQGAVEEPAGTYQATFGDLIPGASYTVLAWAENSYGVSGYGIADQYATDTFTAYQDSSAPAVAASLTIAQGTGRVARLTWIPSTADDVKEQIIYRGTGFRPTTELAKVSGKATTYNDNSIAYNTAYWYRIQSVDYSGNATAIADDPCTQFTGATPISDDDVDGFDGDKTYFYNLRAEWLTAGTLTGQTIVGGTITGATITATNFTGVTMTSSSFTTAASGKRVEITSTTNEIKVYGSIGLIGSFGDATSGTDNLLLSSGTLSYAGIAGQFRNNGTKRTVEISTSGDNVALYVNKTAGSTYYAAQIVSGAGAALTCQAASASFDAVNAVVGNIRIASAATLNSKIYFGSGYSAPTLGLYPTDNTIIVANPSFGVSNYLFLGEYGAWLTNTGWDVVVQKNLHINGDDTSGLCSIVLNSDASAMADKVEMRWQHALKRLYFTWNNGTDYRGLYIDFNTVDEYGNLKPATVGVW